MSYAEIPESIFEAVKPVDPDSDEWPNMPESIIEAAETGVDIRPLIEDQDF